jgi:hypothetical protein
MKDSPDSGRPDRPREMLKEDEEELLAENQALLLEPRGKYDDCIVGIGARFSSGPLAVYDTQKVLAKLQADGMTEEEAEEYFNFNILGAWMGDGTPIFIYFGADASRLGGATCN